MSWTQAHFKNHNGAEFSSKNNDVKITVPVPESCKNHDFILINISLKSKNEDKAENSRPFDLFVGQKGDYLYVFYMYKYGEEFQMNLDDQTIKQNFINGVLFL